MDTMAKLVYFKESVTYFYKKHAEVFVPILKLVFSFCALNIIQKMFGYNAFVDKPLIFLAISVAQAFLPVSFLYYIMFILIMLNMWKVSLDVFLGFVMFFLICWLVFVRVDRRYSVIVAVTAALFFLKLEYVLPVLLGMTVGFGSILPAVAGVIIYFLSVYMADVSTLLTTSADADFGAGLQRLVNLALIDRRLLVLVVTFAFVIFVTTLLGYMFYERAWMLSVVVGNIAMALLLLSGRLIFELDYTIWRIFLEIFLSVICCLVYRFFRGIGDVSRIEKVSFEDDDYFYYVKAVPKIKATLRDRNVTKIISGENEDDLLFDDVTPGPEEQEDGKEEDG